MVQAEQRLRPCVVQLLTYRMQPLGKIERLQVLISSPDSVGLSEWRWGWYQTGYFQVLGEQMLTVHLKSEGFTVWCVFLPSMQQVAFIYSSCESCDVVWHQEGHLTGDQMMRSVLTSYQEAGAAVSIASFNRHHPAIRITRIIIHRTVLSQNERKLFKQHEIKIKPCRCWAKLIFSRWVDRKNSRYLQWGDRYQMGNRSFCSLCYAIYTYGRDHQNKRGDGMWTVLEILKGLRIFPHQCISQHGSHWKK